MSGALKQSPATVTDREALAVLAATPVKLAAIVSGMDAGRSHDRPSADEWSAAQIIGHLLDTEIAYSHRIRLILAGDLPSYPGFDPSAMLALPRPGLAETLGLYTSLRAANLHLLRTILLADWQRAGLHQEEGRETVSRNVQKLAEHDLDHLSQLERALVGRDAEV